MEVFVHIQDGKPTNQKALDQFYAQLTNGRHLIKSAKANKRSLPQNGYYFAVICEMVKDALRTAGYREVKSKDDAHEIMKALFLKKRIVNEVTDEAIVIPGSTAKLTTTEFSEYIEEIIKWSSEYLGISIPLPNQQSEMFY